MGKDDSLKPKNYHQRYRKIWESDARFKEWLRPVASTDSKARCLLCYREIQAHLKSIIGHSQSKHHIRNSKMKDNGVEEYQMTTYFEDSDCDNDRNTEDLVSKKIGQLLLKGFKLLASSCDECGGVLMEDKGEVELCVRCNLDRLQQGKKSAPAPISTPEMVVPMFNSNRSPKSNARNSTSLPNNGRVGVQGVDFTNTLQRAAVAIRDKMEQLCEQLEETYDTTKFDAILNSMSTTVSMIDKLKSIN